MPHCAVKVTVGRQPLGVSISPACLSQRGVRCSAKTVYTAEQGRSPCPVMRPSGDAAGARTYVSTSFVSYTGGGVNYPNLAMGL